MAEGITLGRKARRDAMREADTAGYRWADLPGDLMRIFGNAGRAGIEGMATALSGVDEQGRSVGSILPFAKDERTGEVGLAAPRILDLWNTAGGVVPAKGITLGAGPVMRAADGALDMSQDARMARAREMGFDVDNPVYHGTRGDIETFDPARSTDVGMHFGTSEQANKAAADVWTGEVKEGANVIPAYLRAENVARVPDVFNVIGQTYIGKAKKLSLGSEMKFTSENRAALYEAAKEADKARRKMGGDWGRLSADKDVVQRYDEASKKFYEIIEKQARDQGLDALVYSNKVEGKGDSYVVFDPSRIRSVHATFDPAKRDSADLLASRAAPGSLGIGGDRRLTYRDIEDEA